MERNWLNNVMLRDVVIPGVTGALYYGSEEGLGHATADLLKNKQQLESGEITVEIL